MGSKTFGSMADLITHRASVQPDLELYAFLERGEARGRSMTAAELARQAGRVAGCLQGLSEPGGRVILVLPNRIEFAVAFLGCLLAGMVAVPAHVPRAGRFVRRFLRLVQAADTRIVLTNSQILADVDGFAADDPSLLNLHWMALETLPDSALRPAGLNRESLAFLQFTSGSTGEPKGVMVSHGNLLHNLSLLDRWVESPANGCLVSWLPFFHDWGLIGGLLWPLYLGCTGVIIDPLDFLLKPLRWLRAISAYRATISGAPNFAYDLCARAAEDEDVVGLDLSSWESAIVSAEPVRAETLERFAERFAPFGFRGSALTPAYGLAEATLVSTATKKLEGPALLDVDRVALEAGRVACAGREDEARSLVACGRPLADLKVAIVGQETGARCAADEIGEIWISGPSVTRGYWRDAESTRETFMASLGREGPWLRTGDLGFMRDGYLYVTGRSKDLIILAGRNLYPQDIELAAEKSHPALRPGCGAAFSVDGDGRERLVLVQEIAYGPKPDLTQVIGAIQRSLAAADSVFADVIAIVEPGSIPKTSSGKIRRKECRQLFLTRELRSLAVWENAQSRSPLPAGEPPKAGRP